MSDVFDESPLTNSVDDPSICWRHIGVPAGPEPCERCGHFLCLICLLEGDITGHCGPCYEPLPKLIPLIDFRKDLKTVLFAMTAYMFVAGPIGFFMMVAFSGFNFIDSFYFMILLCAALWLIASLTVSGGLFLGAKFGNPGRIQLIEERQARRARHLRGAMGAALSLKGDTLEAVPGSPQREDLLDSILADLISGLYQKNQDNNQ